MRRGHYHYLTENKLLCSLLLLTIWFSLTPFYSYCFDQSHQYCSSINVDRGFSNAVNAAVFLDLKRAFSVVDHATFKTSSVWYP